MRAFEPHFQEAARRNPRSNCQDTYKKHHLRKHSHNLYFDLHQRNQKKKRSTSFEKHLISVSAQAKPPKVPEKLSPFILPEVLITQRARKQKFAPTKKMQWAGGNRHWRP